MIQTKNTKCPLSLHIISRIHSCEKILNLRLTFIKVMSIRLSNYNYIIGHFCSSPIQPPLWQILLNYVENGHYFSVNYLDDLKLNRLRFNHCFRWVVDMRSFWNHIFAQHLVANCERMVGDAFLFMWLFFFFFLMLENSKSWKSKLWEIYIYNNL